MPMSLKSCMVSSTAYFVALLALAAAMGCRDALAARLYNFGLAQKWSQCAGPGRYNVRMTFQPIAGTSTYHVGSGNKCQLNHVVCGVGGGCGTVTCGGPGRCEMVLGQCQQGRGGSWIGITGAGLAQRARTAAPRRCQ
jgi:hypothetical protein